MKGSKLSSKYCTHPSCKTVKAMLEARCTVTKEKALAEIKQTSAVSLTADIWPLVNMDAYLGVTCHYLLDSLDLATVCSISL